MKFSLLSCRWLVVVCLAPIPTLWAVTSATDYVEGEVLVRFDASKTLADAEEVAKRHGLTMTRHFDWLSAHEGQVIALLRSPTLNTAGLLVDLRAEPAIALAERAKAYIEEHYKDGGLYSDSISELCSRMHSGTCSPADS